MHWTLDRLQNYVNCPNFENPETRNTDYEVFSGHVILLTKKSHSNLVFFLLGAQGVPMSFTLLAKRNPHLSFWDGLKDIHSCDVVWKFDMFQPQICGASVYQK